MGWIVGLYLPKLCHQRKTAGDRGPGGIAKVSSSISKTSPVKASAGRLKIAGGGPNCFESSEFQGSKFVGNGLGKTVLQAPRKPFL
jgi:hypothetical protein